jgi:hypothetical protein
MTSAKIRGGEQHLEADTGSLEGFRRAFKAIDRG